MEGDSDAVPGASTATLPGSVSMSTQDVSEPESPLRLFLQRFANTVVFLFVAGYAFYWIAQQENSYATATKHDFSACMADRAQYGTSWVCSCRNENVKFSAFTNLNVDGHEPANDSNWDWQVCSYLMSPMACNNHSCANFNWNDSFVDIARFCSETIMIVQTQFNKTSREAPDGMFMSSPYLRTQPELEISIKSMVADILDRQFRVQRAIQEKVDALAPIKDVIIQALDDTYYNYMIGEKYNFVAGLNSGKNVALDYENYTAACQPQLCTLTQQKGWLRWTLDLVTSTGGIAFSAWKIASMLPLMPVAYTESVCEAKKLYNNIIKPCGACIKDACMTFFKQVKRLKRSHKKSSLSGPAQPLL